MGQSLKPSLLAVALAMILAACNSESGSNPSSSSDDNDNTTDIPLSTVVPNDTPSTPDEGLDPFYIDQWHLKNVAQFPGARAGEDINVEPVWAAGTKGEGVLVVIVDDGLQINHRDLVANIAPDKSWDYNDEDTDPSPVSSNYHGTNVGGIIAARDLNNEGLRGVAPRASLAAYNLLWDGGEVTNADVADAMTRNVVEVAVSNNSWGLAVDGYGEAAAPTDFQWHEAIEDGVTRGRNGRGTVYVWAGGNGGANSVDNSNLDFQANNRHVMAICAVRADGKQASYSEPGANLWLCAPSGDELWLQVSGQFMWQYIGMSTTDLIGDGGVNPSEFDDYPNLNYTNNFSGTSASTPVVSGVVALMLEANPTLGWRDVRLILAESARKNDPSDSDWATTNPALGQSQFNINHKYGFGVVDAEAAVALATEWVNVGEQVVIEKTLTQAEVLPDNNGEFVEQSLNISGLVDDDLVIEYVELDIATDHQYAGDLEIILTGPQGTQSRLAETHPCISVITLLARGDNCLYDYNPWTFASVRHLGESSVGDWTLRIEDKDHTGASGQLMTWTLRIYGRRPS